MRLAAKVEDWMKAGLINQSQAQQILSYESKRSSNVMLIGFYVLAISIICLGVVSVIAFNWESIPDIVKLGTDLIVLVFLAFMLHNCFDKNSLRFEIILLAFILFCMASIGLIGQVYNLSSPMYVALLTWAAMTLPVILFSKRAFNWFVWIGGLLIGVFLAFTERHLFHENLLVITICIFMALIPIALYSRKNLFNDGCRLAVMLWMILWLLFSIGLLELYPMFYYRKDSGPSSIPMLLALIAVFSIWCSNLLVTAQRVIASLIVAAVLASLILAISDVDFVFLSAIQTVTILILSAILAATLYLKATFNIFIGLIMLRCIVLYFEALGGLATTGFGLIMAGVLILYLTAMWKRYGNKLLAKLAGWNNDSN